MARKTKRKTLPANQRLAVTMATHMLTRDAKELDRLAGRRRGDRAEYIRNVLLKHLDRERRRKKLMTQPSKK